MIASSHKCICPYKQFKTTFENPQQKKLKQCNQCDFACYHICSLSQHLKTHCGKRKQMQPMWIYICIYVSFVIWGLIWKPTVEKCQTNATSVILHAVNYDPSSLCGVWKVKWCHIKGNITCLEKAWDMTWAYINYYISRDEKNSSHYRWSRRSLWYHFKLYLQLSIKRAPRVNLIITGLEKAWEVTWSHINYQVLSALQGGLMSL